MQEKKWIATFAERLNSALDKRNVSAAELAKSLNISEATISNYRKGKYEPKQKRLDLISQILNVDIAWLMGADTPFTSRTSDVISVTQHPLLQIYNNLNPEGQDKLMDYAQDLSQLPQYKKCSMAVEQDIG